MARPRTPARRLPAIGIAILLALAGRADAQDVAVKAEPTASSTTTPAAPGLTTKSAPSKATSKARSGEPGAIGRESVIRIFTSANPMIWLLGLCSVVTLGFGLERLVALRRGRVIPKDFVQRFHDRLSGGKLDRDRAIELCKANDSPAARIFAGVVRYWGQPAALIRQAVEADAAGEVIDLKRNVRALNGTSTLAPLLGLLGTVIGMIESFNAIGPKSGSAKSEALAQGISLALVSTAIGLGIAIVSVSLYYVLLGRVDGLVRDLDEQTRRVIDLVSAEAIRPAASERRPGYAPDSARHESRVH